MNETNAISNDGVKRLPAAGQPHLPHIVTVGRYRVGRVLERLAQPWSGEARFSHISASFDDAVAQVQALNLRQPIDALVGAGASGAWIRERVDIPLAKNLYLNFDVKKVFIKTDVSAGGAKLGTFKVDPVLVGVGLGWRF